MDIRQRTVYPTAKQKRKLIALMEEHPQLVSFRTSQNFNHRDSEKLWNQIAAECNSIPGARKTWRQWRKTWQDIKAKVKKKQQRVENGEVPTSIKKLTESEQDALVWKNVSSTTNYQDTMEFVAPEDERTNEDNLIGCNDPVLYGEPASPPELKIDLSNRTQFKAKKLKNKISENHSENCVFNCDRLAIQEERKILIKEDYYNFKKDYLKQKLLLMKEQTEALKGIAIELSK